jgi:hypothetical protein
MRSAAIKVLFVLALTVTSSGMPAAVSSTATSGAGPAFQYIGPLAFGPGGVLFAADQQDVTISALELGKAAEGGVPGTQGIAAVDQKIAALLGTDAKSIIVTDLAVHPKTHNAFISVMRGQGANAAAALLRVDGAGHIVVIALDKIRYSRVSLPAPPPETPLVLADGRSIPVPNYPGKANQAFGVQTITHMAYTDGRLLVSGLSNEEFASKLRSIPYPFTTVDSGTSVEIYHGSHGQFETRSPVHTFVPYSINGEPYIIASYLCTPLVKIPVASLRPGVEVRGTTIAELGNRNRPIDMIVYKKDGAQFLLMSNNSRGVMKIPTEGFASAAGISTHIPDAQTAGVPFETIANMKGVEQLDLLDSGHSLILARSDAGSLNLEVVPLP